MKKCFLLTASFFGFLFNSPQSVQAQTITTVAGCGIGNDSLATKAELFSPTRAIVDNAGNTYIADNATNVIRKVDVNGIITTFAGTGQIGYSGDGGPALVATLGNIYSLAFDRNGNMLLADDGNNVIRKIDASGIITTIAGSGVQGYAGDGGAATDAQLTLPSDVAADTANNIYIADRYNYVVRKVDHATGIITTFAGNNALSTIVFGGPATATSIGYPFRVTTDNRGNLFIGSYYAWHIMKVDGAGILTNVAGTGSYGSGGDGGPATAATLSAPWGLVVDTNNNVFFSDFDAARVRMINTTTGNISTVAGSGVTTYSGDGGPATAATLAEPAGLYFDTSHNLYIADYGNNRIRKVNTAGVISTFAGQNGLFGEGYPGPNAEISAIGGLTCDAAGNVYIADMGNHRVRMLSAATGELTTVAGGGISCGDSSFYGDGGQATAARLFYPSAVALDASGNIYICDEDNQRIRKVNTSGGITTIAGNGSSSFGGEGVAATSAEFQFPTGITVDAAGNVYVVDKENHIVRRINTSGIINTIAGTRVAGYSGDGGAATLAELSAPVDVAVDPSGNIYVSDQGNNRIRKIDVTGIITTIAGTGASGHSGDGGPATAAELSFPEGIKFFDGKIIVADANNNSIRMINDSGIISTIAGMGSLGFSGDGGPATSAQLNNPVSIALNAAGDLYIADEGNYRVRKVSNALKLSVNNQPIPSAISIYPNPAHSNLNIVNAANSLVIIDDITGKEVIRTSVANTKGSLDISSLASGVYMVRVIDATGVQQTVKVTKE